jgi:hypothetical protein
MLVRRLAANEDRLAVEIETHGAAIVSVAV